jgi:predicted enzyme involved in methoxymalonyl-ACP biosynthesis
VKVHLKVKSHLHDQIMCQICSKANKPAFDHMKMSKCFSKIPNTLGQKTFGTWNLSQRKFGCIKGALNSLIKATLMSLPNVFPKRKQCSFTCPTIIFYFVQPRTILPVKRERCTSVNFKPKKWNNCQILQLFRKLSRWSVYHQTNIIKRDNVAQNFMKYIYKLTYP